MGFFTRTPTVEVAGAISRIGIERVNDTILVYALTLEGDARRFSMRAELGKGTVNNLDITMAKPGDWVRFGVKGPEGTCGRDFFENLTMADKA